MPTAVRFMLATQMLLASSRCFVKRYEKTPTRKKIIEAKKNSELFAENYLKKRNWLVSEIFVYFWRLSCRLLKPEPKSKVLRFQNDFPRLRLTWTV